MMSEKGLLESDGALTLTSVRLAYTMSFTRTGSRIWCPAGWALKKTLVPVQCGVTAAATPRACPLQPSQVSEGSDPGRGKRAGGKQGGKGFCPEADLHFTQQNSI